MLEDMLRVHTLGNSRTARNLQGIQGYSGQIASRRVQLASGTHLHIGQDPELLPNHHVSPPDARMPRDACVKPVEQGVLCQELPPPPPPPPVLLTCYLEWFQTA